jgi:hypothetical protein
MTHSKEAICNFFDDIENAILGELPYLHAVLDDLLPHYSGIPSAVDVFEILGLRGNEDRHTLFLAWLLDPRGTHGLNDRILRRFLLLTGNHDAMIVANQERTISCTVGTQVPLGNAGIPDLTLVIAGYPSLVLIIEAKIDAGLTNRKDVPQTTRYRKAVEKYALKELLPYWLHDGIKDDTVPVLVFLRAYGSQEPEPDLAEEDIGRYSFSTVDYRDLEYQIADVSYASGSSPAILSLIQQFRTSVLASACGDVDLITNLERIRLMHAGRNLEPATYTKAVMLRDLMRGFVPEGVSNV